VKRQRREVTVEFKNLKDPEAVEHLAAELGRLAADLYLSGFLKFPCSEREAQGEAA
jgi:hypothetical protein